MIYILKCESKADNPSCKFIRSFFAECEKRPRREQAAKLLNQITGGDFLEGTIEIQELPDFDAEEVKSQGGTLFIL